MEREINEVTDLDIDNFMASFIHWGYRDIASALETYRQAGKYDDDLRESVENFIDGTGVKLDDVDVCYVAYDSLQQEAREEIEKATGKDISNDDPFSGVNVFGNYFDTSFDGSDESREATKKLIDTMEEKSDVVQWYYNQL